MCMKALLTLLFIILCGIVALAKTNSCQERLNLKLENYHAIKYTKMGAFLDSSISSVTRHNEITRTCKNKNAYLHKGKVFK